jgi:spore coat-associated protein N
MQRFAAVWAASPRKLMGALLMLLVAGGLAVGSGASFTSQTASPGNMITAGALTVNNDKKDNGTEGAIFHADNMKPGDTVTGTVTVSNTGNVDGDFNLSMAAPSLSGTGSDLSSRLHLKVEALDSSDVVTATPIAETLISSVGTSPVSLGTWVGNSNHKYRFTVTWPAGLTGDNAYMSSGVSMDFTWSATQA